MGPDGAEPPADDPADNPADEIESQITVAGDAEGALEITDHDFDLDACEVSFTIGNVSEDAEARGYLYTTLYEDDMINDCDGHFYLEPDGSRSVTRTH